MDVRFGSVAAISSDQSHMTSNDAVGSRRPPGYKFATVSFPVDGEMPNRQARVPNPFGAAGQNVWRECPLYLAITAQLVGV